jgi:Putative Flp pilus-assembly TadE/G-like
VPLNSARDRAHGQTIVIFAIFLVVLLGSTALAVDYGSWLKARRDYQNVADAASLAGSVQLTRPVTAAKQIAARQAAWKSIKDQLGLTLNEVTLAGSNTPPGLPGVTPTGSDWRIWVSTPPVGGATSYAGNFAGSTRVVYVWLERNNQAYFSRVFGLGDRTVSAWATAGTFANRFAVITLRKKGMATNGNPTDLDVNGGTVLNVFDGDVGGNWGMSVNGVTSAIVMHSSTTDTYGVFLNENVPTGGNGWTPGQVRDSVGNPVGVQFQAEVVDPNYPAPCLTFGVGAGNGCLEDRAVGAFPPNASTARVGDTCPYPVTNVDRLPAGHYNDITVPNNKCLVLDPTFNPVTGKENGIFYITGTLNINNSGLVLGDGVTLVFDRDADLDMNAGATISLNSGNTTNNPLAAACGGNATGLTPNNCKFAAWTARAGSGGNYSWSLGTAPTYASPPVDPFERGIATYICKTAGAANCGTGGGPSTDIFQLNSSSGIDYQGLIYAPFDNVKLAGQPTHDDVGQLVSWTAMFTGGTAINQTFDGPDSGTPVLLEPRIGQ